MIALPDGLGGERRREYRQFARWCAAADLPALPARAATVLAYLAADPEARPATQRARVTAINAAHRLAGLPLPGEAEAVRAALNPGRAERLAHHRAHLAARLPHLPTTGWPEGLTGRRDAALLVLAGTGMSWRQIARLRQRDLHLHDHAVIIGDQPLAELPATGDPTTCPVAVLRRWAQLLAVAPPATGHIHLERALTGAADPPPALLPEYGDLPVLTDFDDRGMPTSLPGELDPLSADAVAAITAHHLTAPLPGRTMDDLDPTYYDRGIAARARARELCDDLDELFERLDELTDTALDLSRMLLRDQGRGTQEGNGCIGPIQVPGS